MMGAHSKTINADNFVCKGKYSSTIKSVVVLAKKRSPTRDIYLSERLKSAQVPVHQWFLGEPAPCDLAGAFVIIVRYVDGASVRALAHAHEQLAGVAYLLDDDIRGAWKDAALPKHYRLIMGFFWAQWRRSLELLTSELWLSSDALVEKYGHSVRIDPMVAPFPLPRERLGANDKTVRIACHGSKTHRADLRWLRNVIVDVQARCDHTEVEIIGDSKAVKYFKGIPRTTAFGALSWDDYRQHVENSRIDIGLVPLLDTPFNRARSWAKYLDVARLGAVGVFSDCAVYNSVVEHGKNGLLISNADTDGWGDGIVRLCTDAAYRQRLVKNIDLPQVVHSPSVFKKICN